MKAYLIYKSSGGYSQSLVGLFLNENKAKAFVREKNEKHKDEIKKYEKCSKCRCKNCANEDDPIFLYKDSCGKAVMKEDRYGLYCENDDSDFYETVESDEYWISEVEILD
jgi:hypothetical protein